MLKIYSAENMVDAQLFKDQLEHEGIEALVKGSYLSGAVGELPPSDLITVWLVEDAQKQHAEKLLQRFEAQQRENNEEIICLKCSNSNPGSFELCWSCGANLKQ